MLARGIRPDALTDQTCAHDPANGYLPDRLDASPNGMEMRERDPDAVAAGGAHLDGPPCRGDAGLQGHGRADLRLWQQHPPGSQGRRASPTPSTSPASSRPMSARSSAAASARSAGCALSRRSRGHLPHRRRVKELIPDDPHLHRWLDMARERIAFQGLPARICWVGLGQRHRLGLAFNEMVRNGEVSGADRHRPRPSRQRLGRLAQPRDRER